MQPFRKDVASYFYYPRQRESSSGASSPISPGHISGNPCKTESASPRRPQGSRSKSEYASLPKKIHVQSVKNDLPSNLPTIEGSFTPTLRDSASIETMEAKFNSDDAKLVPSSLHQPIRSSPADSGKIPKGNIRYSTKESHACPPGRPRLDHTWARTTSGSVWFETKKCSGENIRRTSSSHSAGLTPEAETLHVRTDQTPLRPPASRSAGATGQSKPNSIKVEIEFTESRRKSRQRSTETVESHKDQASRRSSFNPKHIFSAPLLFIRRSSLPKQQRKAKFASPHQPPLISRNTRLADHVTLLKRNYTSDALARVSAILQLQDARQSPQNSLWPPAVIKPLRIKTMLSEKAASTRDRKEPEVVQGISTQFTHHQTKSAEALSDTHSYTSSQRVMRLGAQPTNTPEEQATYRVKRSSSAETEEFLKVDISIRGGTSYLPSEARRIHTPPLPEAGIDGRWRGFFFDYNAPRSDSGLPLSDSGERSLISASASSASDEELSRSRATTVSRKLERTKSKHWKRILTGDWYEAKLAELDLVDDDEGRRVGANAKNADKRAHAPGTLLAVRRKKEEEAQFDLTIPEHLSSSPLCPRHPRYWRVVKGKGSQFRGCWMHG